MREIVSPLSGIRSPFGQPVDPYKVAGRRPPLVLDFDDERYRVGGAGSSFDGAITHAATTNATMVDSDGLIKWRPHNLLTYSEDAASANSGRVTVISSDIDGPFAGTTADRITQAAGQTNGGFVGATSGQIVVGVENTYKAIVKNGDCDWLRIQLNGSPAVSTVWFDIANGAVGTENSGATGLISDLGDGWYEVQAVVSSPSNFALIYICDGNGSTNAVPGEFYYLHRRQNNRTDLGGMVNNPDRGDSYVPTTSQKVFLPRRGHYVYSGSAWVNEGLLHESEARTNLIEDSQDGTQWSVTTDGTLSANSADSPLGTNTATLYTEASGNGLHRFSVTGGTVTADTVATCSFFFKNNGTEYIFFAPTSSGTAGNNSSYVFDVSGVPAYESAFTFGGSFTTTVDGYIDSNVEDWGDGWYRISLTFQKTAGSGAFTFSIGSMSSPPADGSTSVSTSYAGDGASGFYITGVQSEFGAQTPSSYIPTSGNTVERAAETLTIPAANMPWPSPNVIGAELVTNGTFDTDTSGWTAGTSMTLSAVSGDLRITRGAALNQNNYQQITTVAGKAYQVSWEYKGRSAGSTHYTDFRVGTSIGAIDLYRAIDSSGSEFSQGVQSAVFVASGADTFVTIVLRDGTSGDWIEVDNISVREIDPLAVSLQMEGRMTYADDGATVEQVYWFKDSSNYIRVRNNTSGAQSGYQQWLQNQSGVLDQVTTAADYYSPGILVPFNTASRHGSTFINGAVDGTALTENTTPVALPDLESTDLNLGYDYMGTIKTFRAWAVDLTDDGIEEASS